MEEKMMEVKEWIKANKKKLVLAGISVTALVGIVLGLKNREAILELWEMLQDAIENNTHKISMDIQVKEVSPTVIETIEITRNYTVPKEPFDVRRHIRVLPEGMHHSLEKAMEAAELGIDLSPNETLVNSYPKYVVA